MRVYFILLLCLVPNILWGIDWSRIVSRNEVPFSDQDSVVYEITQDLISVFIRINNSGRIKTDIVFRSHSQTHIRLNGSKVKSRWYYATYLSENYRKDFYSDSIILAIDELFCEFGYEKPLVFQHKYVVNRYTKSQDKNEEKLLIIKCRLQDAEYLNDSSEVQSRLDDMYTKYRIRDRFQSFFWNLPPGRLYGYLNGSLRFVDKVKIQRGKAYP